VIVLSQDLLIRLAGCTLVMQSSHRASAISSNHVCYLLACLPIRSSLFLILSHFYRSIACNPIFLQCVLFFPILF
jgi:hypothetical protein